MRIKMTETSAELTRIAGLQHDRFMTACHELLNGNPYDGAWIDELRTAMDEADAAMKASWVAVDG